MGVVMPTWSGRTRHWSWSLGGDIEIESETADTQNGLICLINQTIRCFENGFNDNTAGEERHNIFLRYLCPMQLVPFVQLFNRTNSTTQQLLDGRDQQLISDFKSVLNYVSY